MMPNTAIEFATYVSPEFQVQWSKFAKANLSQDL